MPIALDSAESVAKVGRVEDFTPVERARLAPHFSNLDGPVFALVNLPETVKGALFARYSRYPGTLRRLFLDEFADSLPGARSRRRRARAAARPSSTSASSSATATTRWPSSAARTSRASGSRTCSRRSSSARGSRAYLEQSTRYIAYDAPMPGGGYRYYRDAELGPEYEAAMDSLFGAYSEALPRVARVGRRDVPAPPTASRTRPRRRAVNAKALDLLRGLLPAASLSHMGIYATGQAYEQLILHLIGHPLPEARALRRADPRGDQGRDAELRRPRRAPRPRRRLGRLPAAAPRGRASAGPPGSASTATRTPSDRPSVRLLHVDGDEDRLLAALLFEAAGTPEERHARRRRDARRRRARARMLADLVGERANRRHRPGRGFEALRYRFEIVSDYGAFRDLQRHRMLTVQWQALTPDLGADVPEEVVEAGCGDLYARRARALARGVRAPGRRRPGRGRALRALPRLPHPLRARLQRARGDAPDRAALGPRGPPELPRGRARDARR